MASYVIRNNEDIFSVINKTVGDLNNTYNFLLANPETGSSSAPTGLAVEYERAITTPPAVNSNSASSAIAQKYTSRRGQTIYDVCLMTVADFNRIYELNFNNIITPPLPGSVFNFNTTSDNILKRYVKDNGVVFTTAGKNEDGQIVSNFILRQDGGYLLREDGGKFIRQ